MSCSLQKNGRFALVARVSAHTQQGRRRIEDAPDRRCFGSVQSLFNHLLKHFGIRNAFGYELLSLLVFQQVKRPQSAIGNTRRILDGCRAAWQGNVSEVHKAFVCLKIRKQHFATPNSTIEPVARTVERKTAYRAFQVVFAHNGKNVRMVMLHTR